MTSTEQVKRLLLLVPYLLRHPGISVAEVAHAFAIAPRQVQDDLNVLWMCGLPEGLPDDLIEIDMDAVQDEGVIRLSNADYLVRPLRFTHQEAVALVVALSAVAELGDTQTRSDARSAAAKLVAISGQTDPVMFAVNTGDQQLRTELVAAIRAGERLRLSYDGQTRGETTHPVVDPVGIAMRDSVAYLQAWSLTGAGWRYYRLDRIQAVLPTGEPVADHGPAPNPQADWFDEFTGQVDLELTAAAGWVIDYYPVRDVVRLPEGIRATFAVADPAWLRGLLLRLGAQVRRVRPVTAVAATVAEARTAIELTRQVCGILPGGHASDGHVENRSTMA